MGTPPGDIASTPPPATVTRTHPRPTAEGPAPRSLPDEPLVVIEPRRAWGAGDLRDLWAYRELLYFLMWRDVKVRYKQTALGVAWIVLQPLLMMLVFTLFFGRLAGMSSDGIPYSLFAYAGLLPWMFFANAASVSGNSVVGSANLLTKVYFPRVFVPVAAVGSKLVDFFISFAVLCALMAYQGVGPTWGLLALPALVALLVMLALGFGVLAAALNVNYRDVGLALPFVMQLWFFASPIIYPLSLLPERWRWVLALNPMTGIIEGFRVALYGHKGFDWASIAVSCAIALSLLVCAALTFRRMEKSLADVI